jgi:hypothetical protein
MIHFLPKIYWHYQLPATAFAVCSSSKYLDNLLEQITVLMRELVVVLKGNIAKLKHYYNCTFERQGNHEDSWIHEHYSSTTIGVIVVAVQ